jgi:hypothetical protein
LALQKVWVPLTVILSEAAQRWDAAMAIVGFCRFSMLELRLFSTHQ